MSLTILDLSFSKLKENVLKLDKQVYDLAAGELELTSIEPVLYLYAIIKLGPANASARWMIELGLTEDMVLDYIKHNLPKRPVRRGNLVQRVLGLKPKPVMYQLSWSPSLRAMVHYLRSLDGYRDGSRLFVRDVFMAVIDSFGPHVEELFALIDVPMDRVRIEIGLDQRQLADLR